jgi:hypothetical protein
VAVTRARDYPYLPGEEDNPLVESARHFEWITLLGAAARNTVPDRSAAVLGNVRWVPRDGGAEVAPDLMVIPGRIGTIDRSYDQGHDDPAPVVCVEVVSRSNIRAELERKAKRYLQVGVSEIFIVWPDEGVDRWALDVSGEVTSSDAVGRYVAALDLTFARDGQDRLGICCPAGRFVLPGSDTFAWLAQESRRADVEANRADAALELAQAEAARADTAETEVERLRVRLAALEAPTTSTATEA